MRTLGYLIGKFLEGLSIGLADRYLHPHRHVVVPDKAQETTVKFHFFISTETPDDTGRVNPHNVMLTYQGDTRGEQVLAVINQLVRPDQWKEIRYIGITLG